MNSNEIDSTGSIF